MANQLDMAEQQIRGYAHAKRGYSLTSLVDSMGLKKSEWNTIQEHYNAGLTDEEISEINEYFDSKSKKN